VTIEGKTPLVSVIIPCYNQGKYLSTSIESALSQTHANVEIVVVNDGSTDNTAEIAARYPSVRYFAQPNRGVAETRNAGFAASRGDFVQFLDADDRLTEESLDAHLRCFAAHPEAGFVVGEIEWIDEINQASGKGGWPLLQENWYEELLKVRHVANTIAVMFRRCVLETVGGFVSFFTPAEDYEMLVRAAREFPSAHHTEVVAQYRRHTTNTSRRGALMLKATNRVMVAQRPLVKDSPRLEAARRAGDRHWRDFFGGVTIKETWAHLLRADLLSAVRSVWALAWYVRGRIFVIPWKFRRRAMKAVQRRLQKIGRGLLSHFSTVTGAAPARSPRSSDPPA
jgi:glycosyltransferase involved in cell wall biosynthesis